MTEPTPEEPTTTGGPRRVVVVVAVLAVIVAAVVAVVVLTRDDADDATATESATTEAAPDEADGDEPTPDAVVGDDTVGDPYAPASGATGYDALHYDIRFSYDPDDGRVEGVTTMTAEADEALAGFSVDLYELAMGEVTVDGEEAEFDVDGRDVRITPAEPIAEGEEFVTEMAYSGVPEPVISAGFPTGWLTTDAGGAYVIGEPDGAATWFPGNDHPSDKATLTLSATVPRGWVAASNGAFEGRRRKGDAVTWAWSEDDPIATYLVTVAIDQFRVVEEETDGGLPLISFYPEDDADRLTEDFADAGDMVEAFEEVFGPYPFDEYGAIVIPESLGYALETQTRSTFGIDVASMDEFQAHELAHQWFGDSMTPSRWEDIWLNEGFATYGEMLWSEASEEGYDIDADAESRRDGLAGYDEDPIRDPGVDRWFSEAVYQRGGLALHALRRTAGDEDFFEILKRWSADFRHANVTTDDFIALSEEISGDELDALFEAWLEDDEIPALP